MKTTIASRSLRLLGPAAATAGLLLTIGFAGATQHVSARNDAAAGVNTPATSAAQRAWNWVLVNQHPTGALGGGSTGEAAEGLFAARSVGINPGGLFTYGFASPLHPFASTTGTQFFASGTGPLGKTMLGLAAADVDPRAWLNQFDLAISMTQRYSPATPGALAAGAFDQSLGMLGLVAAGEIVSPTAITYLVSLQQPNGGFESDAGFGVDSNSTAIVIQALVASGQPVTHGSVLSALSYLKSTQNADGGFDFGFGPPADVNSTGYALQAILAAGQDPLLLAWSVSGTNPISYLIAQQQPDGSMPGFSISSATLQGLPALTGKPFPALSRKVALRKLLARFDKLRELDGNFWGADAGGTVDALNAYHSLGGNVSTLIRIDGTTPLSYLKSQSNTYAISAERTGKLIVGVVMAGGNASDVDGESLLLRLHGYYSSTTGQYGSTVRDQSWAILGKVAGTTVVASTSISALKSMASPSGGFGGMPNAVLADVENTSLALLALRAGNVPAENSTVSAALAFLERAQLPSGGFSDVGPIAIIDTTGLALQAYHGYDNHPRSLLRSTVVTDGSVSAIIVQNAMDALLKLQHPDGSFDMPGDFAPQTADYSAGLGIGCVTGPIPAIALPFYGEFIWGCQTVPFSRQYVRELTMFLPAVTR